MRVRLKLNPETIESVGSELARLGIEVSNEASLILTEEGYREGEILCRMGEDRIPVPFEDILYIESLGKEVFVYSGNHRFVTLMRLYVLEKVLPPELFVRISNSVIINRNAIRRIRPALSQKFYLTLKNGAVVDVTRTYYVRFKEYYGI